MRTKKLLLLVVFNIFWAGTLPANKVLGAHLSPGQIVSLRFLIAAIAVVLVWPWLPGRIPRGWDFVRAAAMGIVVFVIGQRLQVLGNAMGTAGNSSVLMAFEPVLTSVVAAIFLHEHIAARRWVGFVLGIVGIAVLNGFWRPDFHWTSLGASLIFISSFCCEVVYSIVGKPLIPKGGLVKILGVALFAGTSVNLLFDAPGTWVAAKSLPLQSWLLLGYMAVVCTSIGYAVWLYVIEDIDVNIAALTIFMQPIAGVPMAVVWLGESFHRDQFWGCLIIASGLLVGLWQKSNGKTG